VGPSEEMNPQCFDLILNVSDSPCWLDDITLPLTYGCIYQWIPIEEMSNWGYEPFFASKRLLDRAFKLELNIGIHCHAGVHRSPAIAYAWMLSNNPKEEVNELWKDDVSSIIGAFKRDVERGTIPKLQRFHMYMNDYPEYSLLAIKHLLKDYGLNTDDRVTTNLLER
jgi:hypothetical protein